LGFFVFVSFGSRGLVLVGFFLSFFGLFFYFKLCVFSCILPVYQGAPDAFNKVSLLLIKKILSYYYYCIGNSRPPSVLLNGIFKLTVGE